MGPETITTEERTFEVGDDRVVRGTLFRGAEGPGTGTVLVCLPGGTYSRGYFDLVVPGHPGYSFARWAAGLGWTLVAVDNLGTGESSRPDAEVGIHDVAAANAVVVDWLRKEKMGERFVAVGHSMGGYYAVTQQALSRSYDALAVLGTTIGAVAPLGLPGDVQRLLGAPRSTRQAAAAQFATAIPDRYVSGDRSAMMEWFYRQDVPAPVVEADLATTLTVVPRRAAAESTVPGFLTEEAAAVDVPLLLAYGEVDVSADPRAEPAFYRSCPDLTLYIVAGSGHCHNMASARERLWDRTAAWLTGLR